MISTKKQFPVVFFPKKYKNKNSRVSSEINLKSESESYDVLFIYTLP